MAYRSNTVESTESPLSTAAFLSKVGWNSLAGVVVLIGKFAAAVVTTRVLGPSRAGVLVYLLWVSDILVTVTGWGLPVSLTRFKADLQSQGRMAESDALSRWTFWVYVMLAVVGAATATVIGYSTVTSSPPVLVAALCGGCFLAQTMAMLTVSHFNGEQRYRLIAGLNGWGTVLLIVGVVAGTSRFGLAGALGGYVGGYIVPALFSVQVARSGTGPGRLERSVKLRYVRYTLFTWLALMCYALVWARVEVFFLARYMDTASVANYSVGINLASIAMSGPLLLIGALMPHFSQLGGEGNIRQIGIVYQSGMVTLAALLFPSCFLAASVCPLMLPVIYGSAFSAAVPSAVVVIACAALTFSNVGLYLLYGLEKAWFIALSGFAGAVFSIGGCILAIPRWGILGAAASRVVVQSAVVVLILWYIHRALFYRVPFMPLLKVIGAAAAAAVSCSALLWTVPRVWAVAPALALGAGVYGGLIWKTGALPAPAMSMLESVWRRAAKTAGIS